MAYQGPRLRGGWSSPTPWPLGQIPDPVILSICSNLVYSTAVGRQDIKGDDWGDIFAASINGEHHSRPLGIVDVALENTAWSAKTVQVPLSARRVRLISGRNNPGYSFGNTEPLVDIQTTGSQVLQIWNARVEEAMQAYPHLRTIVLTRDRRRRQYKIFEYVPSQFDPSDYTWRLTKSGISIQGYDLNDNVHTFTWQSSGGQFTIIRAVSGSARSFEIREVQEIQSLDPQQVLSRIGYSDDWVTFI